jgi:hypothetical protein
MKQQTGTAYAPAQKRPLVFFRVGGKRILSAESCYMKVSRDRRTRSKKHNKGNKNIQTKEAFFHPTS